MSFIKIDELNILDGEIDSELYAEFKRYFEPMVITDEQKENRIKTAFEFYDVMMFFFALVNTAIEYNQLERTYMVSQLKNRWQEATEQCVEQDDYIMDYTNRICEDIAVVTIAHLEPLLEQDGADTTDSHWLSDDRAIEISENASNVLMNYGDLQEAYEQGYTKKTWNTMHDSHVRATHRVLDGKTIALDEYFFVGEYPMMCPMDEDAGYEETANCRCSLTFS